MKRESVRLTEMSVQLTLILATIIRDQLHLRLCGYECWTLEHVANWDVRTPEPEPDATQEAWDQHAYENPLYHYCAYLASGTCRALKYGEQRLNGQVVDLRVRCQKCNWVGAGLSHWDIELWLRLPDGTVEAHQFRCDLNYGNDRVISLVNYLKMRPNPPKRIAFPVN